MITISRALLSSWQILTCLWIFSLFSFDLSILFFFFLIHLYCFFFLSIHIHNFLSILYPQFLFVFTFLNIFFITILLATHFWHSGYCPGSLVDTGCVACLLNAYFFLLSVRSYTQATHCQCVSLRSSHFHLFQFLLQQDVLNDLKDFS